ncbi:MAG: hypothetical protein ACPGLV_15310 [Bacteroidia bacterium]
MSVDLKIRFCNENQKGKWTAGPDGPFIHFENEIGQFVYLDFFLDSIKGKSFIEYYKSRYYYKSDLKIPDFKPIDFGDSAVVSFDEKQKLKRNGKVKSTYQCFTLIVFHRQKVYFFWGCSDTAAELKSKYSDFIVRIEFIN